jgi:hypothetical protein
MPRGIKGSGTKPVTIGDGGAGSAGEGSYAEKVSSDLRDKRILELEALLAESEKKRTDAEEKAFKAAAAQGMLMQNHIEEVPTGKTVIIRKLDPKKPYRVTEDDDGKIKRKPNWIDVEVPTFYYRIELPTSGGFNLTTNQVEFMHGEVYEFDIDTLRSVKERVYRQWQHEASINGSNENAYRRPKDQYVGPRMR